jgi:cell division protein FtsL
MATETFEYAIRKDVRNNPIVREVDRERQQDLWRAVGVSAFLVLALLVYAWQHFDLLHHGYRFGDLEDAYARESEINRHLRLERDTLRSPARIEALATERLGMVRPGPHDETVIERVAPAASPAPVLARR